MINKINLSYLRRSLNGETIKDISEKEGITYYQATNLRRRAIIELDKKYIKSGLVKDVYLAKQNQKYTRLGAASFRDKEINSFWLELCAKEEQEVEIIDIRKESISVLEINLLSIFKLTINKIETVERLIQFTKKELLAIKGFYKPNLIQLERELGKHGLALKEEHAT